MRALLMLIAVTGVIGCEDDDCCKTDAGAGGGRVEVALIPVTVSTELDLLFVIDDSPAVLDLQTNLKANFPNFVNVLNSPPGGLPSVHIGVVSTDLGTKGVQDAAPGPGIGSGPGSCFGAGKAGNLQTNGTTLVSGTFISDTKNTDGTRTTNYTGTLSGAFSAIASLGASGCGFEQPIEAARRALDNNPANTGFLRPAASLGVVIVTDEDDCSFSHATLLGSDTATLGPLQSFRCTRFGVTCSTGGATEAEMNQLGDKSGCHSNEASPYMTRVADYVAFFKGLKTDPRRVVVAALTGPATPFTVEARTPPGGGTAIPALAHSCSYNGANGPEVADPAVRVIELVNAFGLARGAAKSMCSTDLSPALVGIAQLLRGLQGDSCIMHAVKMPADCQVFDQGLTSETMIPQCGGAVTTNCYTLAPDTTMCAGGLKLDVMRSQAPAPDTMVSVRCYL